MDRITAKTGGLFNLKEMAKAKEKRQLIDQIITLNIEACKAQNVPYFLLGFETKWKQDLEAKGINELKRELKLKKVTV